jgi:hypothetical protein
MSYPKLVTPHDAFSEAGDAYRQATLRLQRACNALAAVSERQRLAVAEWRREMALLRESVDGVRKGLEGYRAELTRTQHDVNVLGGHARTLETMMSRYLDGKTLADVRTGRAAYLTALPTSLRRAA